MYVAMIKIRTCLKNLLKGSMWKQAKVNQFRQCTSHTPSMQTSPLWSEQEVPSLTLLDMAKKKSKSSAMQYSLQMSSSAQRRIFVVRASNFSGLGIEGYRSCYAANHFTLPA